MTLQQKIQQLMQEHPDLFPTEAKVWSYIRGCLRRGFWEKSAMKHRFKQSNMTPPPEDYTGRGKKGSVCALSGEWQMTSKLEVDHKDGNKRLLFEEDILPYIIHLLASNEDELQLVDRDAHKCKSYAERMGITFEEALIEKQYVIPFNKLNSGSQCDIIRNLGFTPENTKPKRKEQYRQYLKQQAQEENF